MGHAIVKRRGEEGWHGRGQSTHHGRRPSRLPMAALVLVALSGIGAVYFEMGSNDARSDSMALLGLVAVALVAIFRMGPSRRWDRRRKIAMAVGLFGGIGMFVWDLANGKSGFDIGTSGWIALAVCALLILWAVFAGRLRRARERRKRRGRWSEGGTEEAARQELPPAGPPGILPHQS